MSDPTTRHQITRAFCEIAHTLEYGDDADDRIRRALTLLQELVPYRCCALLSVPTRTSQELYTIPELEREEERRVLSMKLANALRRTEPGADETTPHISDRYPHLMLPVVGLDRVIGIVRVEPHQMVHYDADHVGLLSTVCAQLGAYLTGLQLRDDQARRLRDLESAHDFQKLLVGVVGHDLRNPLGIIMAGAAILQHSGVSADSQQQIAGRIQKNVRRASKIIDDLLDLTQIQLAGGLQLRRRRTDLRELTDEIAADVRLAHPEREIVIEANAEQVHVDCDVDRMNQVIANLLGNAVRHATPSSPVRIAVGVEGDDGVVTVRNLAPAIPEDLLRHIFDPFTRGSTSSKHGLGLGLYIVSEIVRSHGGRIEARSTSEETTFKVSLPVGAPPSQPAPPFSFRPCRAS